MSAELKLKRLLADDVAEIRLDQAPAGATGTENAGDRLRQAPVVRTLHAASQALPAPSCIALYGAWGTGKTTVLNALYEQIREDRSTGPAIWFDPWHYEGRADLLTPLLQTIMRAGSTSETKRQQVKCWGRAILKTVVSVGARVGAAAAFGPAGLFLAEAGAEATQAVLQGASTMNVGSEAWDAFETALQAQHDDVRALPATFARLIDAMLEGNDDGRVYIFLDDLDRCLPDSAVALIEAIKLFLCGGAGLHREDDDPRARVVFIFGLDRRLVGEAIQARYPASTLYSGETYLEKIFDLSLEVPPVPEGSIKTFIVNQWSHLRLDSDSDAKSLYDLFGPTLLTRVLGDPVFANPRVIKRTLNRLALLHAHADARKCVKDLSKNPEHNERLLWWIAGAERYRAFRLFFATASDAECERLGQAVAAIGRGESPQLGDLPRLRAFLDDPGFVRYYGQLVPAWSLTEQRRQTPLEGDKHEPLDTLADMDIFLRRRGL